jgi:hypothetical protein
MPDTISARKVSLSTFYVNKLRIEAYLCLFHVRCYILWYLLLAYFVETRFIMDSILSSTIAYIRFP